MKSKKAKIAIITSTLVLLMVAGLGYMYHISDYNKTFPAKTNPVDSTANAEQDDTGDYISEIGADGNVVYVLFMGIDRNDERDLTMGVFRTDTLALARFDLINKKVKVLSIPRDTYTFVPIENKLDKINHAYAYGSLKGRGPEESMNAVNHLLGRHVVDYYFLMDMEPIPEIVDKIGGVEVDVNMDMYMGDLRISKGLQRLNGEQSRLYLRFRKSPAGDIDRIQHQQRFMLSLFQQQKAANRLFESTQIVLNYHDDVKTNLNLRQCVGLARYFAEVPNDNVEYSIIEGRARMIDGISYWVMKDNETKQIISDFLQ